MKYDIYCPSCAAAGIKRKLLEAEDSANGTIRPYCKGCKRNVIVKLHDGQQVI